jgi:hypothetical protein
MLGILLALFRAKGLMNFSPSYHRSEREKDNGSRKIGQFRFGMASFPAGNTGKGGGEFANIKVFNVRLMCL